MKRLLIISLGCLLSACTSISDYFGGEDNLTPPAPVPVYVNSLPVTVLWETSVGDGFAGHMIKLVAAVSDRKVFAADRQGEIAALDKTNGDVIWEKQSNLAIAAGPGYGDGLVVVGTSDAEVLALNEIDGRTVWQVEVSSEVLAVPQIADGIVIVRTVDGRLYGLDAKNGGQKWFYDWPVPILTLRGASTPVIADDIVVIGFATGKLAALNLQSGDLLWESSATIPSGRTDLERMVDIDADPIIRDDTIYVATYQGQLAALELETGVLFWKRALSVYAGITADWGQLYVTDENSHIWAVDPSNGASAWKQIDLNARRLTAPVIQGDYVVVADLEGYLHWMKRSNGDFVAKQQIDDEGISIAPTIDDDILYVLTNDGHVAAIKIGENIARDTEVEKLASESAWWKFW